MSAVSSQSLPAEAAEPPSTPTRRSTGSKQLVPPSTPSAAGSMPQAPEFRTPQRTSRPTFKSQAFTEELPEPPFATPPGRSAPTQKTAPPSTPTTATSTRQPITPGLQTPGIQTSGLQTPQRKPKSAFAFPTCTPDATRGSAFAFPPCTPDATRRSLTTPPSGPRLAPQCRSQEVRTALQRGSANLLSVALLRSHSCCAEHCVIEAVRLQHLGALDFLLSHGANDFDEHCGGRRPLHVAIEMSMSRGDRGYALAERLLQHGARPDACVGDAQNLGDAPLHDVARRGLAPAAALLLAYGAEPSSVDAAGRAPLHTTAQHASAFPGGESSHADVARLLLRHGANPFQLDGAGQIASAYAFVGELKDVLLNAEQQFNKQALALALSTRGALLGVASLQLPEVFDAVGLFL